MWQLTYLGEVLSASDDRNELEFEVDLLISAEEGYHFSHFKIQPKLALVDISSEV